MRRFLAVVAVGTLSLGCLSAEEAITIKTKKPAKGHVVKETKTVTENVKVTVMGQDQNQESVTKLVYTEEVLEKPDAAKRPTKLKRVYETAEMTKNGAKEDIGLAGKTVLVEKAADGYKITVDGQEPSVMAALVLKKEFRKEKEVTDEHFLPKIAVKVGDTWKIDMAPLARDASGELEMDADKSSGTGKLIKVYEKDGKKFGTIEVTLDLTVSKIGEDGGQQVELKEGSKFNATAVMDVCIDGTATGGAAKMTVKGDFTGTTMGVELKFDLTSVTEEASEVVKK